ncbi:putative ankyrin-repeat protein [Balamuthia mandrillaris]
MDAKLASFHAAVAEGNLSDVKRGLKKEGWSDLVEATNKRGQRALHIAAENGHLPLLKLLLEKHKADVDAQDRTGFTPLLIACSNNQFALAQYLLRESPRRPDLSLTSVDLSTVLHYFVRMPLPTSAERGDYFFILKSLIDELGADPTNKNGETPLHMAISKENDPQVLQFLIHHQADVDVCNKYEDAPLHLAVRQQNKDLVAVLLGSGANASAKNRDGLTPAELAASNEVLARMFASATVSHLQRRNKRASCHGNLLAQEEAQFALRSLHSSPSPSSPSASSTSSPSSSSSSYPQQQTNGRRGSGNESGVDREEEEEEEEEGYEENGEGRSSEVRWKEVVLTLLREDQEFRGQLVEMLGFKVATMADLRRGLDALRQSVAADLKEQQRRRQEMMAKMKESCA